MLTALFALLPVVLGATYPRVESWSGNGFLDGFNYDASTYDNTTNGDTFWARPGNTSLIYTTDAGTTILKVDNTTFVPYNEKRYAPKLLSKSAYGMGTVWVMDATHMPYGCSVWPAFWTQGPNWPAGGEIDIVEGINQQTTNQIAVHGSDTGCQADPSAAMSGNLTQQQCANSASSGAGCTIVDPDANSYGAGFAAAGGGVYLAELGDEGVKVWFFSRGSVPSSVTKDAENIDTGSLGTPVAYYPNSACDVNKYFLAQTLTINIALCGDWAGVPSLLEQTCGALQGDKTCYTTYVIDDAGATYANAYFEINYINIFSSASATESTTPDVTGSSGSGAGASGASRSNSPTTTLSGGAGTSASAGASQPSGGASVGASVGWTGMGVAVMGVLAGLGVAL